MKSTLKTSEAEGEALLVRLAEDEVRGHEDHDEVQELHDSASIQSFAPLPPGPAFRARPIVCTGAASDVPPASMMSIRRSSRSS